MPKYHKDSHTYISQVSIEDIHVRYEDYTSTPGRTFAAGITLGGLSVFSTNHQWEPAFLEGTVQVVHKLAKLDSLAVYFSTVGAVHILMQYTYTCTCLLFRMRRRYGDSPTSSGYLPWASLYRKAAKQRPASSTSLPRYQPAYERLSIKEARPRAIQR